MNLLVKTNAPTSQQQNRYLVIKKAKVQILIESIFIFDSTFLPSNRIGEMKPQIIFEIVKLHRILISQIHLYNLAVN